MIVKLTNHALRRFMQRFKIHDKKKIMTIVEDLLVSGNVMKCRKTYYICKKGAGIVLEPDRNGNMIIKTSTFPPPLYVQVYGRPSNANFRRSRLVFADSGGKTL